MSDAAPSAAAANDSPSAAMILARFSRSASACLAIARFMLSGSWMSFSSTSVTSTPQSGVVGSRIFRMPTLIRSVSDEGLVQAVLSHHLPQGRLRDLIDRGGHALDGDNGFHRIDDPEVGSDRGVALTLSFVMMPCDWIGRVTMRSATFLSRSMNGTITARPGGFRADDSTEAEQDPALVLASRCAATGRAERRRR